MKLFSKDEIEQGKKRNVQELVQKTDKLVQFFKGGLHKYNDSAIDYAKIKRAKEFEVFVRDLNIKRANLLKELATIEKEIELRKDILYGIIDKQDAIQERELKVKDREGKLDLQEKFINESMSRLDKEWTKTL